jgi:hypothetical protein
VLAPTSDIAPRGALVPMITSDAKSLACTIAVRLGEEA